MNFAYYLTSIVFISLVVCIFGGSIQDLTKQTIQRYLMISLTTASNVYAVSSPDLRESIAKNIANVPGYGQPDIFYPSYFFGDWSVEHTININTTSSFDSYLLSIPDKTLKLSYTKRYIEYNDNIIQERSYSETQFMRKYLNDPNLIATWDYRNPNNLNILTSNNKVIERKVTKRAVEKSKDMNLFGYSEYSRTTESSGATFTVPQIYGSRVLARYKLLTLPPTTTTPPSNDIIKSNDSNTNINTNTNNKVQISGIERLYLYSGETLDTGNELPIAVLKSSLLLTKR